MALTVLGVDQSLNHSGAIILAHNGRLIHAEAFRPTGSEPKKLVDIYDWLDALALQYRPQLCVREDFSFGSVGRKYTLGAVAGMVDTAMFRNRIPTVEVAPKQRAKFATTKGGATKDQVIRAVEGKWQFQTTDDNVADAYVLARIGLGLINPRTALRHELEVLKLVGAKCPELSKK